MLVPDRQMLHFQHRLPELRRSLLLGKLHLPAHHQVRQILRGRFGDVPDIDQLPLVQDRTAVGNPLDLRDLVGDQNDRLPVLAEVVDDLHQEIDLLRRQYCGRLVKDHDLRFAVEHLQDLHPLADGHRYVCDPVRRIDFQSVGPGQLADLQVGLPHVHPGQHAQLLFFRFQAQHDVFGNGKRFHQFEMLMDHTDAAGRRVGGGMEADRFSVYQDLALVRLIDAEQDAHQRGFPGAVFSQQRVDLSLADPDGDVVVGNDPRKALGDVPHLHNIVAHGFTVRSG